MAGQDAETRVDFRPDALRDAEDHGAGEGAPQRAHSADDDRLEGVEQRGRPGFGRECRPDARENAADCDQREGEAERDRIGAVRAYAHQACGLRIVGCRAQRDADPRVREKQRGREGENDCGDEHDQREFADGDGAAEMNAIGAERRRSGTNANPNDRSVAARCAG